MFQRNLVEFFHASFYHKARIGASLGAALLHHKRVNFKCQTWISFKCTLTHLGAASNDSRVFKTPANFSLTRSVRPIFFGGGKTRCPGAGLSQVFVRRVLEELASSINAIDVKKIIPNHGLNGRGLKSAFVQVF